MRENDLYLMIVDKFLILPYILHLFFGSSNPIDTFGCVVAVCQNFRFNKFPKPQFLNRGCWHGVPEPAAEPPNKFHVKHRLRPWNLMNGSQIWWALENAFSFSNMESCWVSMLNFGGVSNIRKCKNAYSLGRDKTVMILVTTVPGKGMEGGHPNTWYERTARRTGCWWVHVHPTSLDTQKTHSIF